MPSTALKVGDLARRTGLTVRALHYYDAIGLLRPSGHTESGHRLYTEGDVARLQQIVSLRQLGWSLEEVRDCLSGADFSPLRVIERHIAHLQQQIELEHRLVDRLEALASQFRNAEAVSVEDFLQAIEGMTMFEKYYTAEQRAELAERHQQVGEERIKQVEAEWPPLIAQVKAEMDRGTDPASPAVQALAQRWQALVNEFTGGNPGIEQSLRTMVQQEPALRQRTGIDATLMEYVGKAMKAGKQ